MDRTRWEKLERLYGEARDRSHEDRAAFLDEACRGDPDLRREIWELLEEYEKDPEFLERAPPPRVHPAERPSVVDPARYIDAYRLVRQVGRGGMGEVYLAVHEGEDFEQTVAVKVIRRGMDTHDVLARFKLERRILASLQHPNIAGLLDGGFNAFGFRPLSTWDFACQRVGERTQQFASFGIVTIQTSFRAPNRA